MPSRPEYPTCNSSRRVKPIACRWPPRDRQSFDPQPVPTNRTVQTLISLMLHLCWTLSNSGEE